MKTLLADYLDVDSALAEELSLSPGIYEVQFLIYEPLSHEDVVGVRQYCIGQGIDVKDAHCGKIEDLWYLGIKYRKAPVATGISIAPALLIPLVVPLFTIALIGIGIFKLGDITENIGKLLIITFGGTIVLAALLRKPLEQAATKAVGKYI